MRKQRTSQEREFGEQRNIDLLKRWHALCDACYTKEPLIDDLCQAQRQKRHRRTDDNLIATQSNRTQRKERSSQ